MVARPLGLPPAQLASDVTLPVTGLDPVRLVRISAATTGEPYFGRSGANRFDDPGCAIGKPEYGSCYLALGLDVAIAESLLHDEVPDNGKFRIAGTTISRSFVHRFSGKPLRLLDLTGPLLKRLDGNADLAGTCAYAMTQQWALAVYRNPKEFDGFMYMSRHLNTGKAVLLFDRAGSKLQSAPKPPPLLAEPQFATIAAALGIVAI